MDNDRPILGVWMVVHHITNTMSKLKATRSLNLTFTGLSAHISNYIQPNISEKALKV